jgi:biopolymer transport protein TolR
MLVLLVIFMATAPMIMQGVQVYLPKMQAKAITNEQNSVPIIVSLDQQENLYLNIAESPTKPIAEKQLQIEIAAAILQNPQRIVTVKADERVSYQKVLHAMVLLQSSGVESVGLETEGV